jgi:hypothetical protein
MITLNLIQVLRLKISLLISGIMQLVACYFGVTTAIKIINKRLKLSKKLILQRVIVVFVKPINRIVS